MYGECVAGEELRMVAQPEAHNDDYQWPEVFIIQSFICDVVVNTQTKT